MCVHAFTLIWEIQYTVRLHNKGYNLMDITCNTIYILITKYCMC